MIRGDFNNVNAECEKQTRIAGNALASVCDGAREDDSVGFNGIDASYMHDILAKEVWTFRQLVTVYKNLKKYRNQLTCYGVDYASIPEPVQPEPEDFTLWSDKQIIEMLNGLGWSQSRYIASAGKTVRNAQPTSLFWEVYRANKPRIKDMGYSVSKYQGQWRVAHWQEKAVA